jgi:hypothetical protein
MLLRVKVAKGRDSGHPRNEEHLRPNTFRWKWPLTTPGTSLSMGMIKNNVLMVGPLEKPVS